jgi:hypothetical protein
VRIPVFGAASAGKTHLIMAGLVSLVRAGGRDGVDVTLGDEHSARMYGEYEQVVDGGGSAPKTDARTPPVAVTLRLRRRRRRALAHIFDAAGEALADRDQSSELVYFDQASSLVFVLDPFSVPEVRDQYATMFEPLFRLANPANGDPQSSYDATLERLHGHTVDTRRQRLAFVVTKEDLLGELPCGRGLVDGAVPLRDWLIDQRLDNLVTAAERDFADVRYFLVSAKRLHGEHGADQPLRWLLAGQGVPVPPEPTGAGVPGPRRRGDLPSGELPVGGRGAV